MFTIQVLGLVPLKNLILPLMSVAKFGDLECSPTSVSLIVTDQSSHFVAVLRMSDPFFTLLSSVGDGDYRSSVQLGEFLLPMYRMGTDDLLVTILLPKDLPRISLVYTTRIGEFRSLTQFMTLPPQNEEADEINYEMFVAIDAAAFREIARKFSIYNSTIWVDASASQVKFFNISCRFSTEILLTTARRQCMVGGNATIHGAVGFPMVLNPEQFFLKASSFTNLVWFFWSVDRCTIMKFFTGEWTHILAYYPQCRMGRSGVVRF